MENGIDLTDFPRRLRDAQLWWAGHFSAADHACSLRTLAVRPSGYDPAKEYIRYGWGELAARIAAVDEVDAARSRLLTDGTVSFEGSAQSDLPGRLLAYDPDNSLWEGATGQETDGFFDADDAPPWDTWLLYVGLQNEPRHSYESYLVSWVHADLIDVVEDGIAVSSTGCIEWLDQMDTPLSRQLGEMGLLGQP